MKWTTRLACEPRLINTGPLFPVEMFRALPLIDFPRICRCAAAPAVVNQYMGIYRRETRELPSCDAHCPKLFKHVADNWGLGAPGGNQGLVYNSNHPVTSRCVSVFFSPIKLQFDSLEDRTQICYVEVGRLETTCCVFQCWLLDLVDPRVKF